MTNVKQICCKDAREPVYEEGIVQDVEVVVEGAQLETLEKQRNKDGEFSAPPGMFQSF